MAAKLIDFRSNKNSVSEIIAILVLVAITIILVAILNLYMGNQNTAALTKAPIVSMTQKQDTMFIIEVQNGPVNASEIEVQVVNQNTSIATGVHGDINYKYWYLSGGDTIEFTGMTKGVTYNIRLIYEGNIVGIAKFYES